MVHLDIYTTYDNLADHITDFAKQCVAQEGTCSIALSGGNSPVKLFQQLEARSDFPFEKCCFCWVDERCVGPKHEQSNYGMAVKNMPSITKGEVFRMRGEADPETAANEYEAILKERLPVNESGRVVIDLLILGIGPDGHIASLFPEEDGKNERERNVIHQYVRKMDSYRISLTKSAIEAANKRIMMVIGKADTLKMLCEGGSVLGDIEYTQY